MMGGGGDTPRSPGHFGEVTSAVVLVNPVINEGSTSSVAPSLWGVVWVGLIALAGLDEETGGCCSISPSPIAG